MNSRLKASLKRGFLFLLIPGLLFYFFWYLVSLLDDFWHPLFRLILKKEFFWGSGLLTTLILIFIIGFVITSRFFQTPRMANLINKIWAQIPIFKFFFGKEFFLKEDLQKTKAVLVEYPSAGWFCIGFLTGKQKLDDKINLYKIFIPTVPLPATGLFGMTKIIDGSKIIYLKNPPLEIFKLMLSCGLANVDLNIDLEKNSTQNTPD